MKSLGSPRPRAPRHPTEAPEAVAQRADRLIDQEQLPVIIIDEAEESVSLAILQFPLWLAFAPDPKEPPMLY